MANLTQTAANVGVANVASFKSVQVGEAVTQGMPGYLKASDGKYWKALATTEAAAAADVIFLTPASTDGYSVVAVTGTDINLGATLTLGVVYVVSATAGLIAPSTDLTTGQYITVLGVPKSTSVLQLVFNATGQVAA